MNFEISDITGGFKYAIRSVTIITSSGHSGPSASKHTSTSYLVNGL